MPTLLPAERVALALAAALLGFAFVAAPRSCEWGLDAYVWSGAAAVLASIVASLLPWARRAARGAGLRVLFPVLLVAGTWVLAFFVADFRLSFRLF